MYVLFRNDATGSLNAFRCSEVIGTYFSYEVQRAVSETLRIVFALGPFLGQLVAVYNLTSLPTERKQRIQALERQLIWEIRVGMSPLSALG